MNSSPRSSHPAGQGDQPRDDDATLPPTHTPPLAPVAPDQTLQPGQMGEGSYEGTRDYQEHIESYLEKADVEADAKAAEPRTPQEAALLKKAEQDGLAHSKAPGQ